MKFQAEIRVMPHKELLDPQGKAVANSMKNLHIEGIEDVRIGKHIVIRVDASSSEEAHQKIDSACQQLLANPIMESYDFTISASE
ncbi:MAG: phosphoribosylformylglycinamidine synthase subunit PurS [Saprospiraceae bacterium]|jgi:phosphoribosylformylglycinamidine synthase PurS subunit